MKNKVIISSILTIALCLSMIAGSTFALFTSESQVNVAVTSGKVSVTAVAENLTLGSTFGANVAETSADFIEDTNEIKLVNFVPGDFVKFDLRIKNESTVTVNYRTVIQKVVDTGLFDGLNVTIGNETYGGNLKYSPWSTILPGSADIIVPVVISLPESAGVDYMAKSCTISYMVEAVQGNVEIVDNIVYKTDENGNKVITTYTMGELPEKVSILEGTVALPSDYLYNYGRGVKEVVVPVGLTDFGGTPNAEGTGASGGFFKKSAVEKVTLPEGLTEIPAAAFNQASSLTDVNIPSSVTTIGISAFRATGLETLVIPATVTSIGYGAFRDMGSLETVIIESGADIPVYAFRGCANLKTVVITNENVTFGNGSSGMIFTNKTNGDGSAITVYVPTQEVADRLLAADTAAQDYGGYKIVVGDPVVENDTEIDEAINDGVTTLILGSGNYIIPDSAQGKTLTIIGNGDTVVATQDDGSYEGCDYSLDGATVTFENVTINTDSRTYTGYARLKATYNNCTINGTYTLYDDSTFNNCTFNVSGDVYNIWTWGATNATFNNCTFNSDGKAVLLYGGSNTNLTINSCTFNDKGGLTDKKAAIEIGDDYKKNFTLTVTNTVVNGYEINDKGTNTGTTLWGNKNSMSADRLTVIVDGVKVYGN